MTGLGCFGESHFTVSPCFMDPVKVIWQWQGGSTEFYAFGLCGGDALGLALPDTYPFVLRNKRKDLQDNVT